MSRPSCLARRLPLLILVSCAPFACQVDDRQLTGVTWTPDTAGSGSGFGTTGGNRPYSCASTGTPAADAGTAGDPATVDSCAQGGAANVMCPDLNANDIPDSSETLVDNANFDFDAEEWEPELGVGVVWNTADACGRSDSGAASITNQFAGVAGANSQNGAMQCLDVAATRVYAVTANVLAMPGVFGGLGLSFYTTPDCSGTPSKRFNSELITAGDFWRVTSASGVSLDDSHSMAVRLFMGSSVPPDTGTFAGVLFDNVLVVRL